MITRPVYIVDDWEEENLIDSYMNHALDMLTSGRRGKLAATSMQVVHCE